ncbi:transposase, partial [Alkalihalophilus marmarensis]
ELLAETGSLQNYEHPRQIIKLAGLTLRENSSGNHQGTKRISKRGRRRLRALLYKAILPLIHNNEAFNSVYTYYHSRQYNPLKKKEAMVVLCRKLIQVFHGLSRNQASFNPERMLADLSYITESRAA